MADIHGDPATTCQGCRHWKDQGADPQNLGAPHLGECRHSPPQLVLLPVPGGVRVQPMFPTLVANQEACGQYEAALVILGNGRVTT